MLPAFMFLMGQFLEICPIQHRWGVKWSQQKKDIKIDIYIYREIYKDNYQRYIILNYQGFTLKLFFCQKTCLKLTDTLHFYDLWLLSRLQFHTFIEISFFFYLITYFLPHQFEFEATAKQKQVFLTTDYKIYLYLSRNEPVFKKYHFES